MVSSALAEEIEKRYDLADSGRITVIINGLRNENGNLSCAVFNEKNGFPGKFEKAFMQTVAPAAGAAHVVVFEKVPYGTYAVAVRHDENGNGRLDTNFIGMPKEGVGTSNNPRTRFGPPSFKDASFVFDKSDLEITLNIRYL